MATAEVVMDATPEDAFAMFTDEIGLWWRTGTRYWNDPERWKEVLGWFAGHATHDGGSN